MSNVEKEYQKRFSEKQENDSDFDTEGLWSAISAEVQPAKKTRRKFIIWIFLCILMLVAIGTFFWNIEKTATIAQNATSTPNKSISPPILKESNEPINSNTETKLALKNNEHNISEGIELKEASLPAISDAKVEQSTVTKLSANSIQKSEQVNKNEISNSKIQGNITNQFAITNSKKTKLASQGIEAATLSQRKQNHQNPIAIVKEQSISEKNKSNSKYKKINIEAIYTIASSTLSYQRNKIDHNPNYISIRQDSNNSGNNDGRSLGNITFDIYGGINYNNHIFSSNNQGNDLLQNESLSAFSGNTLGLSLSKSVYHDIYGSIGVEYNNLWTKAVISQSMDSTKLTNQLVKLIINNQTQDTTEVFMDTTVYALYTRELVHHNNIKTISIPLSIGYHHSMKKIDLGINVGIVYSLRIQQAGKGYNNQGEIFEYNNNSATLPFKKSSIALRLSPLLRYKLNDSYSVTFSPQYQFSNGTYIGDNDVAVKSSVWNLNIGVGKRF